MPSEEPGVYAASLAGCPGAAAVNHLPAGGVAGGDRQVHPMQALIQEDTKSLFDKPGREIIESGSVA